MTITPDLFYRNVQICDIHHAHTYHLKCLGIWRAGGGDVKRGVKGKKSVSYYLDNPYVKTLYFPLLHMITEFMNAVDLSTLLTPKRLKSFGSPNDV